jgi:hypothetical protein
VTTDVYFDYKAANQVQKKGGYGDGKLLHGKKLTGSASSKMLA